MSSKQPGSGTTRIAGGQAEVNAACMAAAVELATTRRLAAALDEESLELKERLAGERRITTLLGELAATRQAETDALRSAVEAKNETIRAKDNVIAAQDKLVETLKTKRPSTWRRIGDILIGAAAIAVLK